MITDVQLPLFSKLLAALTRAPERPDGGLALQPDRFPVEAREREILSSNGAVLATAADPATAQEIAGRLNQSEWARREEEWAL